MATTDRYVFAEVDPDAGPKALHLTKPTDIPAPSPEDWQAIVAGSSRCQDATTDEESRTAREELEDLVFAAVRNMREAER